ncbi:hypothetical protein AT248_00810 [Bartonella henselae]|uniref:Uncharacterized protein n=1 Tax=Bartonella henselae (strain ATCC 49882 / DSM 28221 / CCUG 30454 / Houston 1) TaxID=283166 RepID=A0A0H3LXC2_BARHE|nr:hypothetical protein BhenCHDE101_01210 [Bartonella henselae]ETS10202.1 hypothetical protein Q654_00484 [Bartonella henselae JK 50]ETS10709.1 hypothetical protein Q655_00432 [Bartonella henselae JK 51]PNM37989.1 hypothetical protein AL470_000465 [Bartonella henselae str. Houston-1]OLL40825.1 hypothetical protein AT244_05355 [Bartonella henselae]
MVTETFIFGACIFFCIGFISAELMCIFCRNVIGVFEHFDNGCCRLYSSSVFIMKRSLAEKKAAVFQGALYREIFSMPFNLHEKCTI